MEERRLTDRASHRRVRTVVCCALLSTLVGLCSTVRAEEYRDPCDSSKASWQAAYDRGLVRIDRHERDGYEFHSGAAAEAVQFTAKGGLSTGPTAVRLAHPVPRSLVIDDVKARVWMRSNRGGVVLAVRIVLPNEVDPETGEPVSFDLPGDEYNDIQKWQQLVCQTKDDRVEQQLQLVRGRLAKSLDGRPLNTTDMQVAQVVLKATADRGTTELLLDDLIFGPIVRDSQTGRDIVNVGGESQRERQESRIRIETNRLLVNGKPFFPRIVRYHGEKLDTLSQVGANVAWVEHYDDQILINELAGRGIWSMAAPPPAAATDNGVVQAAGLMPIPATTQNILFWTVGTRVPPHDRRRIESWIDQLRDADRAFTTPRPVLADVIGDERRFSRYVSLLGSTRHTLHTTVPPLAYRDYLDHHQKLALPDRFKWTWVQTEPADGNVVTRSDALHRPVHVEAEQIWWQAWAAVSVGHKAIGYWKTTPLDDPSPAAVERRLALSLLNAQLDLLEPWLATGTVSDSVPVAVHLKQSPDLGQRGYGFLNSVTSRDERDALLAERERERSAAQRVTSEIKAAVIESIYGRLVIPVWYEDGAQFQPGQMAAQDVEVLVRGVDDARAWLVTTTAVVPIDTKRVSGGLQVTLPMMDQQAFIVVTTDGGIEEKLMQRMRSMRRRCGQLWVELAQTKLERVKAVHVAIEATAAPKVPDGPFLLSSATRMVEQAREQLQAEQYPEARRFSRYAMQLLRKLQRTHWENAVARLSAPTASPHTICFNTLPDHWRMIANIGRDAAGIDDNLLRSGDFEDLETMRVDGWEHKLTAVADPQLKKAELSEDAVAGRFCLRLQSTSAPESPPTEHIGPDVMVTSPKVPVRGGQIVVFSGRVRVDRIAEGDIDGMMVYDNVNGSVGALRWRKPTPRGEWETFQIIREVAEVGDVMLTFELHGEGDVRFDDVRIVALGTTMQAGATAQPSRLGGRRNLLDFAPSLPKVNLWPGRKSAEQDAQPAP